MSPKKSKANLNEEIDENLRRVFAQSLEEEVPDRFKNLLDQLRAKDGDATEGQGSE